MRHAIKQRARYLPGRTGAGYRACRDGPVRTTTVLLTLMAVGLLAAAAGAAVVMGGLYDVSATSSHTAPVRSLLEEAMHRSVRLRAPGIEVPEGWGTTPAPQA